MYSDEYAGDDLAGGCLLVVGGTAAFLAWIGLMVYGATRTDNHSAARTEHPKPAARKTTHGIRSLRDDRAVACVNPTRGVPGALVIEGAVANTAKTFPFPESRYCDVEVVFNEHRIGSTNADGTKRSAARGHANDRVCVEMNMGGEVVGNFVTKTPKHPKVVRALPAAPDTCKGTPFQAVHAFTERTETLTPLSRSIGR